MGEKSGDSVKRASMVKHWRPVSPARALAGATAAALGVLTPIYLATNTDLSGPRFLLAILLATCAVLLIVEGFNLARAAKRWRLAVAIGIIAELVSLLVVLVPTSQGDAAAGDGGLRFSLRPTAPELFRVAFRKPISWPLAREGWADLHGRGGIDIRDSHFRLVLANESSAPISVLGVRAEVLGSEPMPHGTLAWRYSQGDEGVGKLAAILPNGRSGSTAPLYESSHQVLDPETLSAKTPYFQTKYILLKPGEVYPATLTIQSETPRTIRYRLTAEGESAERHFVVHSPVYQLVGRFEDPYQTLFARYYAKGHDVNDCTPTPDNPWVDAHNTDRFSACPHGLGGSYEVQPPSSSKYPPGQLNLDLGISLGKQSATIDDVIVGSVPAAASESGVVKPLLGSLGAWDRCSEYLPNTNYWTATWERWGLSLVFPSEGAADCTDASRAGVREIGIDESHVTVDTDLGPIEVGGTEAELPGKVRQLTGAGETLEYERVLVVPGGMPCDPTVPDRNRYRLDEATSGGIVALDESLSSGEIDGLTSTLPPAGC